MTDIMKKIEKDYKKLTEKDDGETEEYELVGSMEADPLENKISNESPIDKAVIDHKKGDTITVESPNGSYEAVLQEVK